MLRSTQQNNHIICYNFIVKHGRQNCARRSKYEINKYYQLLDHVNLDL